MRLWKVVGGAQGGLLVRTSQKLESEAQAERLQHGALLEEVQAQAEKPGERRGAGEVVGGVVGDL